MDRIGKQETHRLGSAPLGSAPLGSTKPLSSLLSDTSSRAESAPGRAGKVRMGGTDWRRKMSDNIAYALLVYTALQIFVTVGALKSHGESLLPYLALVILVVAIIPACRRFEARWNRLDEDQAHDPDFGPLFSRDRIMLWLLAIGLPFAITGLFKGLSLLLA